MDSRRRSVDARPIAPDDKKRLLGTFERSSPESRYPTVARAIYRNLESLIAARPRYAGIDVPVTLVYGHEDWSRPSDRQANIETIPGARHIALPDTGHLAAHEAPQDVARILLDSTP